MAQSTPEAQDTKYNTMDTNTFFKEHVVKDDTGYHLPEDAKASLSADKFELFNTEARRRTTEANLAKERTARIELQAKLKAQEGFITLPGFSEEEQERLDDLKYTDPDAWLVEVNTMKEKATEELDARFQEQYNLEKQKLFEHENKQTREQALASFNANSKNVLTAEMLQYDVPPRLANQLAEGKLTYGEYLDKAADAVFGAKVVGQAHVQDEPSFKGTSGNTDFNSKPQVETLEDAYAQQWE